MEIQFFLVENNSMSMSFDIFVVTYRVTNFVPKLVNMLLFSTKKNWISIFGFPLFSGYAQLNGAVWRKLHEFWTGPIRNTNEKPTQSADAT